MCNPRKVTITATREMAEHWSREVARTVRLRGTARGEARVTEQLSHSQAEPVLEALTRVLEQGQTGWTREGENWHHAIPGGYLRYRPTTAELEIVAVAEAEVEAAGQARQRLSGTARGTLAAEGVGNYYDDNWGGHTEERALQQAQKAAQAHLAQQQQEQLRTAADTAEAEAEEQLSAQAEADGQKNLAQRQQQERTRLENEAAARLDQVGLRAREVTNRLLGAAYREAILTYAHEQGAEIVQDRTDGTITEIELKM